MAAKRIMCPLCFLHKIDEKSVSAHLAVPGGQILEMTTAWVAVCPGVRKEMDECPELARAAFFIGFSVALYKIKNEFRFIFRLGPDLQNQTIGGGRAGTLLSLDETLKTLEELKIAVLTKSLMALKTDADAKIDKKKLVLSIINKEFKPFFTALRAERKIGRIEATTK